MTEFKVEKIDKHTHHISRPYCISFIGGQIGFTYYVGGYSLYRFFDFYIEKHPHLQRWGGKIFWYDNQLCYFFKTEENTQNFITEWLIPELILSKLGGNKK